MTAEPVRLTQPQREALGRLVAADEGSLPLHRLLPRRRMVHKYRVANSLEAKGLITRGGDGACYVYITAAGRIAANFPASEIRES